MVLCLDFGLEFYNGWQYADAYLRVSLSFVTLLSGVGKLMDLEGGRQAMSDFGVPSRWVPLAARLLPKVELALGLAILIDYSAEWAAAAMALMFLLFSLALTNLVRQEKAPPCHCFGAIQSEPVSKYAVLRALGLAVAAFACFQLPNYPLTSGIGSFLSTVVGFFLVGQGIKLRLQQHQKIRGRKRGRLDQGQRLPAVQVRPGLWLESLLPEGKRTLLLFTSEKCGPCRDFKFFLSTWAESVSEELSVYELCPEGTESSDEPEIPERFYLSREDFRRFKTGTPGGFLVDDTGTILSPPASGAEEIEALARASLNGMI